MDKSFPWNDDRCILCLSPGELSVEHIIPAALGGELTCKFLCKTCNEQIGHGFESGAKNAPELRRAALGTLGASRPDLIDRLETGTKYISDFGGQRVRQTLRKDGTFGAAKLGDGSLIMPEAEIQKVLIAKLQRRSASAEEIETALSRLADAPPGKTVDLTDDLSMKRWQEQHHTPD